jgi:hypothetical protein
LSRVFFVLNFSVLHQNNKINQKINQTNVVGMKNVYTFVKQNNHIKIEIMLKAIKLSNEQVKNDSIREYNPTEWTKVVNRYSKFSNVEFFKVEKNDVYQYDRFFVKYELNDGMIFFNSLDYSSSLTNGGFHSICISSFDVQKLEMMPENTVQIFGVNNWINNSDAAFEHMKSCSLKYQTVWSKLGI